MFPASFITFYGTRIAGCILMLLLVTGGVANAQRDAGKQALARRYMQEENYEKAVPILKALYEAAPFDKAVYLDYLEALLQIKKFARADSLVTYMMQIRRDDPAMWVDRGRVAAAAGEKRKAKQLFEDAIAMIDGSEFRTRSLAAAFAENGYPEYAIACFETARKLMNNPYSFATELSSLYQQTGDRKKSVAALIDLTMTQQNIMDDVKTGLAKIGSESEGWQLIEKELSARLRKQPNNPFWQELFSWLYAQQNDYERALKQLIELDKFLDESGKRVLPFAENATREQHFDVARKAFDYILDKGTDLPYYRAAAAGKLRMQVAMLTEQPSLSSSIAETVSSAMRRYFDQFPDYRYQELWRSYARVEALFMHRVDTAVQLLEEALNSPRAHAIFKGHCKLDMADYLVLEGKVWDATLLYSQVDKEFKEDRLGEEARFKNAKLAYYRGDFEWAQAQLSVLKASTTELIANDALYLSVLITENTGTDSHHLPLQRFAAADLLLFQHKTKASDALLDSIATAFPKSSLQDDIAMLRAKIALEEGRTDDAIVFLNFIRQHYGDDILGDDATLRLAQIYQHRKKDLTQAAAYYQKLILDFPGSTYVQEARREFERLSRKNLP